MPRESDNPEPPNTLPLPELNPLMNPVLGENMGRWAEVYFTTPPEKREQAVLDLVRELEAESAAREAQPAAEHAASPEQIPEVGPPASARRADGEAPVAACRSCGHQNPEEQKFCGMCGAALRGDALTTGFGIADFAQAQPAAPDLYLEAESARSEHFAQPPDATEVESSLGSAVGHERALYHYRAYIGGALAVLILALGYMAFRSTQAMSGAAHPVSSTPPAAETEPATRPQAPAHPEVDVVVTRPKERAQPAVAVDDSALDKNPPPPASGSEEFAMAQSYLNGTEGKERNSAEAVKWLWKSVGKQNAAATLLLSDLYVKGEEVPKNCEQARLLLDAAARKRIAGADARLRNLQTMGCE